MSRLAFACLLGALARVGWAAELPGQMANPVLVDPYFASVFVAFAGFGRATPQSDQRMAESGEQKYQISSSPQPGDFVWLRMINNTKEPLSIRTDSMYMGGLKTGMQISLQYVAYDSKGTPSPSPYDTGSQSILPSDCGVFFPVPRAVLKGDRTIRFSFRYGWEPEGKSFLGTVFHEVVIGRDILPPAFQE